MIMVLKQIEGGQDLLLYPAAGGRWGEGGLRGRVGCVGWEDE